MNQDDEQRRRRLMIQTETTQREVKPTPQRGNGLPLGVVIGVVLGTMMLTALVILAVMNRGDKTNGGQNALNANVKTDVQSSATPTPFAAFTPATNIVPPSPTPPQTASQPAPNIVIPPASTPPSASTPIIAATPTLPDDATLQANVNKVFFDDRDLVNAEIDTSVSHGKVTLRGKVNSANLKLRAEKLVKTVRGVQSIDDKITVVENKGGWSQTTTDNSTGNTPPKP